MRARMTLAVLALCCLPSMLAAEEKPLVQRKQALAVDEDSKKACVYFAGSETQRRKLEDPTELEKSGGEESSRSRLYNFCLYRERTAAASLSKIAGHVPDPIVYGCDRKAKNQGDDFSKNSYQFMLECFEAALVNLSEADLPRGVATINGGNQTLRFWTFEDCAKNRADGQVCIVH